MGEVVPPTEILDAVRIIDERAFTWRLTRDKMAPADTPWPDRNEFPETMSDEEWREYCEDFDVESEQWSFDQTCVWVNAADALVQGVPALLAENLRLREALTPFIERGRMHEQAMSGRCHLCDQSWPCDQARAKEALR